MEWRRTKFQAVLQRVAAEGRLAAGWTIETAADLCFALTLPEPVRELTRERDWTPQQYAKQTTALLRGSILTPAPTSRTRSG